MLAYAASQRSRRRLSPSALLMIAGLLLPIAIKRVLLRHVPVLDRMTD